VIEDVVDQVKVSGLVLLKIIQRYKESNEAMGQLLGLDDKTDGKVVLEITNCFPQLIREETGEETKERENIREKEEEFDAKEKDYQQSMMRSFRTVNVDATVVGWYIVSWLEQLTLANLQNQIDYQLCDPRCVCVIFDPLTSSRTGKISIRAIRVKKQYINAFKKAEKDLQRPGFVLGEDLTSSSLVEEIPVEVFNSSVLGDVFIHQFASSFASIPVPRSPVETISTNNFMNRAIGGAADGLTSELSHHVALYQSNIRKYQVANQHPQPVGKTTMMTSVPSRLSILFLVQQLSVLGHLVEKVSQKWIARPLHC